MYYKLLEEPQPESHAVIRRWRPNSAINGLQTWSLRAVPIAPLDLDLDSMNVLAVLITVGAMFIELLNFEVL